MEGGQSLTFGDGELVLKIAGEAIHAVEQHFSYAPRYTGGLFLIWGGLVVIGLLTSASLARSLMVVDVEPRHALVRPRVTAIPTEGNTPPPPSLLPVPLGFEEGREAGIRAASPGLDEALDALARAGRGEARVLETWSRIKRVRVDACASCNDLNPPDSCEFERGFLEGAVSALTLTEAEATEIACRRQGDRSCVFEVTY